MVFVSRTIFVINKELCFPYKKNGSIPLSEGLSARGTI
jgi:hypothetical protein